MSSDAVLTARLEAFYQKYAPEMLGNIPKVLQDFKFCIMNGANEQQLISHLENKYNGKFPAADEVQEGLDALAQSAHAQEFSGMLFKKGRWLRQWKSRYFELRGTVLQMFVEKGDPVPRRVSTIGPGTRFEVSSARAHAFTLQLPGGETWQLAAHDEKQRSAWLTALGNSVVQQEKFQKSVARFNKNRKQQTALGAPPGEYAADVAGTIAVLKHIEAEHLATRKLFSSLEASLDYFRSVEPKKLGRLQTAMASGDDMVMSTLLPNCEPHLLAAALKATLRAREIPLVPFGLYSEFVDMWKRETAGGVTPAPAVLVERLKELCARLPERNRDVASLLLRVCSKLRGGEPPQLLAYTFGPAFLRTEKPPTQLADLLEGPKMVNAIVEFMIRQSAAIFFGGPLNTAAPGAADEVVDDDDDDDDDVEFSSDDDDDDDNNGEASPTSKKPAAPPRPKLPKPALPPGKPKSKPPAPARPAAAATGGAAAAAAAADSSTPDMARLEKARESLRHLNRQSQRHVWNDLKALQEAEEGVQQLSVQDEEEAKAKAEAEAKAKAEAEAKAKAEAEAKAKAEAEAKAKAEAEAKAKAEAEAKAKAEAEAKAKAEAEAKRKRAAAKAAAARKKAEEARKARAAAAAEERAKKAAEAQAKAKTAAEKKKQAEAAAKAEADAAAQAKAEEEEEEAAAAAAAAKAKEEAEAKAKKEAEAKAKKEAEAKAKKEAEAKAKKAAEAKAKKEAEAKAKKEAEAKAKKEAEAKAKKEAEAKAKKEAEAKAKAKAEAEAKAKKEAEADAKNAKKEAGQEEDQEAAAPVAAAAAAAAAAPVVAKKKKGGRKKKGLAAKWDAMAAKTSAEQKRNIFSKDYDPDFVKKTQLKRGDKGYGRAPEGSKSEARAKRAKAWVKEQMDMLLGVITREGKPDKERDGRTGIDFGSLFYIYQDISDTLVGMIRKCRKAKLLDFEGDMLFQHSHGHVMITLSAKGEKRVVNRNLRELMPRGAPAADDEDD